jgi:hypothetical protein
MKFNLQIITLNYSYFRQQNEYVANYTYLFYFVQNEINNPNLKMEAPFYNCKVHNLSSKY